MRRSFAPLALALLVASTLVVPTAAAEPGPSTGRATPTSDPLPSDPAPSATPSATPAPTSDPTPAPTSDPPPDPTDPLDPSPATGAPTRGADPSPADPGPAGPDPAGPDPAGPDPAGPDPAGPAPDSLLIDDAATGRPDPTGRYLVMLAAGADTSAVVTRHRQRSGTQAIRTFERAVRGFSAALDADQRRALLDDPNVVAVVPDEVIELTAQTTPNGISRVGGKKSVAAAIDGEDDRVDADVAIIDTGIAKHPDLNVVGGYNCSTSDRTLWRDKQGHGTHVAGTVGAIDNDFGVVGIAPGVRLWAVKILNDEGYGLLSWYVCGLDWVVAQRDPADASRPLIEAVNMSVAKWGSDDHACGSVSDDILHAAICRVVAGGITVVAAAANDSAPASKRVPAAYNEVITVSALADTDGKSGGLGGKKCYSWGTYDKDDTFADFSNYGADVDIMASGKCIWSTKPGNTYGYSSGTSMAAPAVTGAAALYKATRPAATPSEVKAALQYLGNLSWDTATDPDAKHEKLLDVSRIAKLGSFSIVAPPKIAPVSESGGQRVVPISITRTSTFFERVRFAAADVPDGWSVAFAATSLMGWDANANTVTISVPPTTPAGTYPIGITASNQGRVKTTTLTVVVENDRPTVAAPTIRPITNTKLGANAASVPTSVALRIKWPAATDPTSEIVGYQFQRLSSTGTWTGTTSLAASTRSVDLTKVSLKASHRYRVRAQDAAGNWSTWAMTPTYAFQVVGDRSSTLTYKGTWWKAKIASATNQVRTASRSKGATVTRSFTGRGVSVIMPRSSTRGKVTIFIDGVQMAVVDTYYKSAQTRRVVWSKMWTTSATRRITIKVNGTSGRPTISLDGLLITK